MAHSAAIGAGLSLVLIGIGLGAVMLTLATSDNGLTYAPSLTAQPMTERPVLLAEAVLFSVYLVLAGYGLARWSTASCPGMFQQAVAPRPLPSSLAQKGNPMVTGSHQAFWVLPALSPTTGKMTSENVSGENPLRCGIVESGCGCSGECKDVERSPW